MRNMNVVCIALLCVGMWQEVLGAVKKNEFPYRNPNLPVEERVEDLLSRMTLEEKVYP